MSDDIDVVAVYGRSVTLLGDDWLSRRAERSFRAAQRALDDWHRFIGARYVPAVCPVDRDYAAPRRTYG